MFFVYSAWYLIQHYQRVHGIKIYSTCLNENPVVNQLNPIPSIINPVSTSDTSMLNVDLALFEAALKDMTALNRPLTSSTTFASNQLIAVANAARSAQQQSLSSRSAGTDNLGSTAINSKGNMALSIMPPSIATSSYPSLLQAAQRSNSFVKLLAEAAKQQSGQTCGKDKSTNDTLSLADGQFLTPKLADPLPTRVCCSLYANESRKFFLCVTI